MRSRSHGSAPVLPLEGIPVLKLAEAIPALIQGPQQSGFAAVPLPTRQINPPLYMQIFWESVTRISVEIRKRSGAEGSLTFSLVLHYSVLAVGT